VESVAYNCPEKPHISSQGETMATNLTNFLLSIGDDPLRLRAFQLNPQAAMVQAGLTITEQNMILNGDVLAVRTELLADPDLKNAMGIPASQSLPSKLPMCIFMVPKP
jgi:hypothetical protein